jgi:hypothetical protein
MRWDVEERLRRVLPYGFWKWRDDNGAVVETIFNRRSKPLATRVDGRLILELRTPAEHRPGDHYYFRDGTVPWRHGDVRKKCEQILRDWGLDPEAMLRQTAAEIRAERLERRRRLGFGRRRFG